MKRFSQFRLINYYLKGKDFVYEPKMLDGQAKSRKEWMKTPKRHEVINFLLSLKNGDTHYLEIGVLNPAANFNRINATVKYGVDPGSENPRFTADYPMTSDEFFNKLSKGEVLSKEIRFDVIFIDGLHLAEQVDRDIRNALDYIREDGFIVLHDCNPPTEWHARESFMFMLTPAQGFWNGTTWKAFLKWRSEPSLYSCCIDTDWGVGILSRKHPIGDPIPPVNPFFEFKQLEDNRKEYLNLVDFESFKRAVIG